MATKNQKGGKGKPGKSKAVTRGAGKVRERKDHVLQTRVPLSTYKELVEQAQRLRVPVSNLVRNILEDSLNLVENIVDGSIEIVSALGGKASEQDFSAVLGWQPMIANKSMVCGHCGGKIAKGGEAFLSVGAPGGRTIVICGECRCDL